MATINPFQDYDDDDPNLEQRRNRWNYWTALKLVRKEYAETSNGTFNPDDFGTYLEKQYGIKMQVVDGNITDGYKITDEQKYLIYLLKFQ